MTNKSKRKINSSLKMNKSDKHKDKCEKCNQNINEKGKMVECKSCLKTWHIDCIRVTREEIKAIAIDAWYCTKACKKNGPSSSSTNQIEISTDDDTVDDADDVDNELEYDDDKTLMKELAKSIKYFSAQLDQQNKDIKELKKICVNYHRMEEKFYEMKTEIEKLKQQKNDDTLLISGIPEKPTENLKDVVMDLVKELKVDVVQREILEVKRLTSKNKDADKRYPPLTLVKLVHPALKTRFMECKKKFGPIHTQQFFNEAKDNDLIFFRSFLTSNNTELLAQAKILKESGFKYIWFSGESVQVRKDEKSKIFSIKSKKDIEVLKKNPS